MALATLRVRTTLTPPLEFQLGDDAPSGTAVTAAGNGPASGEGLGLGFSPRKVLLALLRPAWTLETPILSKSGAPAGDPGDAYLVALPLLVLAVLGVLALAVYGLLQLLRRRA